MNRNLLMFDIESKERYLISWILKLKDYQNAIKAA